MADSAPTVPAALTTDAPLAIHSKQTVDPWNVSGETGADGVVKAINYHTLIEEFGTKKILEEDLVRFEKVTGHRPHRFMRRGIVFSHRDLNYILDRYERGEPFFLYTGRGPSSDSMHIGHTVPFEFTKLMSHRWLQDVFDVPLIIMLTDDEKYLFSESREIEDVQKYTAANVKDIIAIGFDPKKTFIFSDYEFMGGEFYKNVTRIQKKTTLNVAKAIFGFDGDFGAIQGATAFASSFPHIFGSDKSISSKIPSLIPCAIDQDPYFRMTRDVAHRLHFAKPALIHARFLDALQGPGSKMSASIDTSAIFMYDEPNKIRTKINKYAFSGGQVTEEEQRAKGGDTDKDVSYQYLTFFLEDDEELERIRVAYTTGKMLTGELKAKCIAELQVYVKGFQERRAAVTDELVEDFFSQKKLVFRGNPHPIAAAKEEVPEGSSDGPKELTKNQLKKLAKEKMIEEKRLAKLKEKEQKQAGDAIA
ncbi:hypothetical protein G7Y89_g7996 [Cudoniella acicularis]|uniref:Tryptophan--tRNA ligase, cytoplasmic n=1 Tax=Cudoniella acicularis TaxID=354080 RepID=A0A8H4W406_9HELO|nr:hypothetical protein G7Y89_g7996 [Cudoniella acicularis]